MILPIRTPRLTVRVMRTTDAAVLSAYRSDPAVAEHQLWDLPFTLDDARRMLHDQDDPAADLGPGATLQLAVEHDGAVVGDVYAGVDETGGVAEIGYTLATAHQGHGWATEAAAAVVEALFDRVGVGRVYGELDPENIASQRVLERIGLSFESHTRASFLWRGVWSDNMAYSATRAEFDQWRRRPRHRPGEVRLVELTHANHRRYAALRTHHSQRRFVSTVAQTFGDALYPPPGNEGSPFVPWLRGIEADGDPVGVVMTTEPTRADPEPYLWRLLIDRLHQRRGIGTMVIEQLRTMWVSDGVERAIVTWIDGPGSPAPLYRRLGFVPTGEMDGAETVAAWALAKVRP